MLSEGLANLVTQVVDDTREMVYLFFLGGSMGGSSVTLAKALRPSHLQRLSARCSASDGRGCETRLGVGCATPLGQASSALP